MRNFMTEKRDLKCKNEVGKCLIVTDQLLIAKNAVKALIWGYPPVSIKTSPCGIRGIRISNLSIAERRFFRCGRPNSLLQKLFFE